MMKKNSAREPAVLEVNLSEQYNKHYNAKTNIHQKKQKPAKSVISIQNDKDK